MRRRGNTQPHRCALKSSFDHARLLHVYFGQAIETATHARVVDTRAITLSVAVAFAVVAPGPMAHAQSATRDFAPLIADPKQPHFFAAWLWVTSPIVTGQVSSIGLGEDISLARSVSGHWEVSVAAGVFSQFNMRTSSNDLLNTDFTIGIPVAYHRSATSLRVKLYHQSSHLGDEFILATNPARVNLSFEALELLVSRDVGAVRAYGGGEYIVRHEPADLKPGLLHAGVEFRQAGGPRRGRLIAAIDAKSSQERKWRVGWSGRLGWEFRITIGGATVRPFSVQLQGYTGPAPYGQFYQENVRSVGVGIHLAL